MLWAAVAGTSPGRVWLDRARAVPDGLRDRFGAALAARVRGVPAAYAAGTAAFRQLDLVVDPRVLIPRPETEGLVECVLEHRRATGPERWGWVADIGTGSGCIALSLAVEGRFDGVAGVDVDRGAVALARENGRRAGRAVPFVVGDLLAPLAGRQFGVIVSNPPYLTAAEWSALDAGVRAHEPRIALVSGDDGLAHTRRLLDDARDVLVPGGLLAIEVDSTRAARVLAMASARGWCPRVEADLFGRPRFLLATRESL